MTDHFYIRDIAEGAAVSGLTSKSRNSLTETKAENTVDAYESDWNDFCDWCRYKHAVPFPAKPETVVNYINDLADYAKAATIRRRISAISENYNAAIAAGQTVSNPCHEWIVKESLIGVIRIKGSVQKGKTPIYWEELEEMVRTMDLTSPAGLRDRALLILGFMGAFRRSELVGLDVEDLQRFPQGLVVTIRESKTDKLHEGQQIGIPSLKSSLDNPAMDCITALDAWMEAAEITTGPLFRRISPRGGKVLPSRLSDKSVNLIVKRYAAAIGLNPDNYGGHSLRHGFATYAALNGVEERLIMKQTRHRSVEMVRHYINEADLFTNNPISKIFGK